MLKFQKTTTSANRNTSVWNDSWTTTEGRWPTRQHSHSLGTWALGPVSDGCAPSGEITNLAIWPTGLLPWSLGGRTSRDSRGELELLGAALFILLFFPLGRSPASFSIQKEREEERGVQRILLSSVVSSVLSSSSSSSDFF